MKKNIFLLLFLLPIFFFFFHFQNRVYAQTTTPTLTPSTTPAASETPTPSPTLTPAPTQIPTPTSVVIPANTPTSCYTKQFGDADCDGVVDSKDFDIWMASMADKNISRVYADFDGDGAVNVYDFEIWRRYSNSNTIPTPTPTLAPSPTPFIDPCVSKPDGAVCSVDNLDGTCNNHVCMPNASPTPTSVPTLTPTLTLTPTPTAAPQNRWQSVGQVTAGCNYYSNVSFPTQKMRVSMLSGGGYDNHISFYGYGSGGVQWVTADSTPYPVLNQTETLDVGETRETADFGSVKTVTQQNFSVGCNDGETATFDIYRWAP